MADVFANIIYALGRCYCHIFVWLMLLPFDMSYCGRCYWHHWLSGCCYCQLICVAMIVWQMLLPLWLMVLPFCEIGVVFVADGIAYQGGCGLWSDVITIGGRWNGHWVTLFISALVLDSCTEPHSICGADGTCLCSCLGMDCWPLYIKLLYGSNEVLVFPPYNAKDVNVDIMTSYVGMVMYWGWSLLMFFEPLSKCSCWFTNVLLITLHPITSISIYDSTFFRIWSLSFEAMRRFLMVSPPLKCTCTRYFLHDVLMLSLRLW